MIGIISYGMGNIGSIWHALEYLGHDAMIAKTPSEISVADRLILPGVGAFPAAMRRLNDLGFTDMLHEHTLIKQKLTLGICLGMQLLADRGTEFSECDGLGWIPGHVRPIPRPTPELRLPHIGWNEVNIKEQSGLFAGIDGDTSYYFVHSFQFISSNSDYVTATTCYGSSVTAAVARENIYGTQFHPEKSQRVGLSVLDNFARL